MVIGCGHSRATGDHMIFKECIGCKKYKQTDQFSIDRKRTDGLSPYCKECISSRNAARYKKNKEKILASNRLWRESNREKVSANARDYRAKNYDAMLAYQRDWQARNREKVAGYAAKWREKVGKDRINEDAARYREANRDKMRAAALRWQKENPGKANAANAARYAAKLMATPGWADLDKIAALYDTAERMRKETGVAYEVDHIVPLRSKVVCGLHCEANLRVIPSFDNRSKGNRHWPDMP